MSSSLAPRRAGPALLAAFADVAKEFALSALPYEPGEREGRLRFEGLKADLSIGVEAFSSCWVSVRPKGRRSFGLHELVQLAAPGREDEFTRSEDEEPEVQLARLAKLCSEFAGDLLRGELGSIPALLRQRARTRRERNQRTFGTATGESPRFEGRPALAALFEDAHNELMRDARCTQALWDYSYSLAEIGAFLGESSEAVQARLDHWDSLD